MDKLGRRGAMAGGLALLASMLWAGAALADNGPHVAGAGATPDSCAACHRAHSAAGPELIKSGSSTDLCLTCHGSGSAGATTDVSGGVLANTTQGLLGGGFTKTVMNTSWNGSATAAYPATSAHLIDGTTSATMWGNGVTSSTANPGKSGVALTCINCHNPHGNGNFRILRPRPNDSGATADVLVADETTKTYTVTNPQNRYFGEEYQATAYPSYSLTLWCAQCHTRYDAYDTGLTTPSDPGSVDSGDAVFRYRHATRTESTTCELCHPGPDGQMAAANPLGITSWVAMDPRCETCHVAHGSSAQEGAYSGSIPWPGGAIVPSGNGRSSLLRLDNRGICYGCHGNK